ARRRQYVQGNRRRVAQRVQPDEQAGEVPHPPYRLSGPARSDRSGRRRLISEGGRPAKRAGLRRRPPFSITRALLADPARDALDEAIEEEVVEDRHGKPDEQGGAHQRAPVVHVATDQLGRHTDGYRLLISGWGGCEPVEGVLHRQGRCEDDIRGLVGQAVRQDTSLDSSRTTHITTAW